MAAFGLSFLQYWAAAVIATVAIGIVWYSLEKLAIVHVYRYFYDVFHGVPMPKDVDRGLVYNRPMSEKRWIVGIMSVSQSLYMVWSGHANPFAEMVAAIIEVPAFLIGFAIGSVVHDRFFAGKYLDKFDKIGDTIGTMRKEDVTTKAKRLTGEISGKLFSLFSRAKEAVSPAAKPVARTPEPNVELPAEAKPEPPVDPREAINKYLRR